MSPRSYCNSISSREDAPPGQPQSIPINYLIHWWAHTHTRTHTHTHTHTRACTHIHTHTHMCSHIPTQKPCTGHTHQINPQKYVIRSCCHLQNFSGTIYLQCITYLLMQFILHFFLIFKLHVMFTESELSNYSHAYIVCSSVAECVNMWKSIRSPKHAWGVVYVLISLHWSEDDSIMLSSYTEGE